MNRWPRLPAIASFFLLLGLLTPIAASPAGEFDRAARLGMKGDYDGAMKEYQSFVSRSPQDRLAPTAAMAVANIYLVARGDSAAAVPWLDRVVMAYPSSPWAPEAARAKGRCEESQKKWLEAGDTYMKALDLAGRNKGTVSDQWMNEVTLAAANSFYAAGDRPRQIMTYKKVLESSPPPEVAATSLARLAQNYEDEGDTKTAAEDYARILQQHPGSPLFDTAMGKRELIEKHVQLDWTPLVKYAEGTALVQAQDLPGALMSTDELLASDVNPPLRECLEYRKITLDAALSGDYTEGCARLRDYLARYPEGQRAQTARRTLEQNWGPIADLEANVKAHPDEADPWRALGLTYVQARVAPKAIGALEKAIAIDPASEQSHLYLGYAYSIARRNDEAAKAFEFYLEHNPEDVNAMNMIGYSYLGLGQADKAIPYFERYARIAPEDPNSHDSLAEGYLNAGRLEESAKEYERALQLNPSFSNSQFMLGRVYQQLGNKDKAIEAYRRFIDLAPAGPQADQARSAIETLKTP